MSACQSAGGDAVSAAGILPCHYLSTPAGKLEATKSRLQREAWLMEKMEKAKAAVQCSCLWVR